MCVRFPQWNISTMLLISILKWCKIPNRYRFYIGITFFYDLIHVIMGINSFIFYIILWINITKKSTKNGIQQVLMKPQYTVNPLLNLAKSTSDTQVQVDINLKRSSKACLMSFFGETVDKQNSEMWYLFFIFPSK